MKPGTQEMIIDGLTISVVRKNIKNFNLSVHPPDGRVRVSVPRRMSEATIRQVIQARIGWIKRQQKRFASLAERAAPQYMSGDKLEYLGKSYVLNVIAGASKSKVSLDSDRIDLYIPTGSDTAHRQQVLDGWYRARLKQLIPALIAHWEPIMGVKVAEWGVKRMKTKWGTCNPKARRIWLNLELVKLSPEYLEYVVVHEMTHLLERLHSPRFKSLLDQFLPGWRNLRAGLNQSVRQNNHLRMG